MNATTRTLTLALAIATLLAVSETGFAKGPQICFGTGNLHSSAQTYFTAQFGGSSPKHLVGHPHHTMPHYPPAYYYPAPRWGGSYCPPPPPTSCNRYLVYRYTCRYGWNVYGEYDCYRAASRIAHRLRHRGYQTYVRRIRH